MPAPEAGKTDFYSPSRAEPVAKGKSVSCHLCGSLSPRYLYKKTYFAPSVGHAVTIELWRCRNCGLTFYPATEEEDLYGYYRRLLELPRVPRDPIVMARLAALLAAMEPMVPAKRLLDVGCGAGELVEVALEQGWDVLGIESSEAAVELCLKRGLPVKDLNFLASDVPAGWGLITMSEVIEHVMLPGQFVRQACSLLSAGGCLYMTTPNYASLESCVMGHDWGPIGAEHLSYFSPKTLRMTIARYSDLQVMWLRSEHLMIGTLLYGLRRKVGLNADLCDARVANLALRDTLEAKRLIGVKHGVNRVLNALGLGSSLKLLAKKLR